ncbi:hypothetical protein K0M31_004088 [Melipona bicolor]|uniref:Uncharacterized protein n=1 Tax=Melipona bicolor TaxID=60889 RepID=A0AA40FYI0_9HYME|nr:hypothetical protein K0M31_004088 [Melipona bicolor]
MRELGEKTLGMYYVCVLNAIFEQHVNTAVSLDYHLQLAAAQYIKARDKTPPASGCVLPPLTASIDYQNPIYSTSTAEKTDWEAPEFHTSSFDDPSFGVRPIPHTPPHSHSPSFLVHFSTPPTTPVLTDTTIKPRSLRIELVRRPRKEEPTQRATGSSHSVVACVYFESWVGRMNARVERNGALSEWRHRLR